MKSRGFLGLGLGLLLLGSGLTACASHEPAETVAEHPAAPAETVAVAPSPPPVAAAPAPAPAAEVQVRPAEVDRILAAVRRPGDRAVVLNVWATWCTPCREEFPDLMRIHREYRDRGVRLMLVSADFDDRMPAVKRFLSNQGVDFPSFIKEGDDMKFINALSPEWTGALPATFIYDGAGKLRYFHEGKLTFPILEKQVLDIVNGAAPTSAKEERT